MVVVQKGGLKSLYPIPAKTVKELIALAKSRPNELSFASAGNVAANHLASELFKRMAGILAPTGTPREIVMRLNTEVVNVLRNPDIRTRFADQGAEPVGNTPEQFSDFLKSDLAKWARVIKAAGVRASM